MDKGIVYTKQVCKVWLNSTYMLLCNHSADVGFFSVSFAQRFLNSMIHKR